MKILLCQNLLHKWTRDYTNIRKVHFRTTHPSTPPPFLSTNLPVGQVLPPGCPPAAAVRWWHPEPRCGSRRIQQWWARWASASKAESGKKKSWRKPASPLCHWPGGSEHSSTQGSKIPELLWAPIGHRAPPVLRCGLAAARSGTASRG